MEREPFVEATVDELLSDPISRKLMERDGLRPEYVWACVRQARQKLKQLRRQETTKIGDEPEYVICANIRRYQRLLADPETSVEQRKVLIKLLAEAKASLAHAADRTKGLPLNR